jgi:hypothetical protein
VTPLDRKSRETTIAEAIGSCLISPNESDSNLEAANVVDGLFFIGRALHRIADAIEAIREREPAG